MTSISITPLQCCAWRPLVKLGLGPSMSMAPLGSMSQALLSVCWWPPPPFYFVNKSIFCCTGDSTKYRGQSAEGVVFESGSDVVL